MRRDSYEVYEQVILSGQMSERDVIAMLDAEPDFAVWYRARAAARLASVAAQAEV